jgi:hypothetical protein
VKERKPRFERGFDVLIISGLSSDSVENAAASESDIGLLNTPKLSERRHTPVRMCTGLLEIHGHYE